MGKETFVTMAESSAEEDIKSMSVEDLVAAINDVDNKIDELVEAEPTVSIEDDRVANLYNRKNALALEKVRKELEK